ncbi:MAG: hypothetical protein ACYTEK_10490 [Planctomycetota bacterium]|jgi:hypothetical protein
MQGTETEKAVSRRNEPQTIAGLLVSALDMEDEIAHSIYSDYMDRQNWPASLKDETFEQIRKYLSTLLDDTQRHRNMIQHLQSKLGPDNG